MVSAKTARSAATVESPGRIRSTFDASRQKSTLSSKDLYKENANVAQQFIGDRLSTLRPPSADRLQPGEGGIVTCAGNKVAAYRDDDGTEVLTFAFRPERNGER